MLKPISNVKVQQRATVTERETSDGYGDLWGVGSNPPIPLPPRNDKRPQLPTRRDSTGSGGQYFTGVKEESNSVVLLGDKRTPSFDVLPGTGK